MKSKFCRNRFFPVGMIVFLMLMLSACGGGGGGGGGGDTAPAQTFGVVALSNVGTIGILDGSTQTLTAVHLTGELGSFGGGLFDVAITPDGKTTLVSNFGDSRVFFIDTSNPAAPAVASGVTLSFFAEDIAITPDGRYALVTDGGFSSKIAVLDVLNRTIVEEFKSGTTLQQFQAVAVAPDGVTVLTAGYSNGMVNALTLSTAGHLTYVTSIDVSNTVWDADSGVSVMTLYPVNLAISPDGKTAIVASVAGYIDFSGTTPADAAFQVLNITGPGVVALSDTVVIPATILRASQSIVFNRAGSKAYAMCTRPLPDPYPADPLDPSLRNVIQVLNVTAPGTASDAGTRIVVEIYGKSQLFGVDTLAMDNRSQYLYVSNPTLSGASTYIQVVDTNTNTVLKTINFDPVTIPPGPAPTDAYPAGISFWHY